MQNKINHEQHRCQEYEQKYQVQYGKLGQEMMLRGNGFIIVGRQIISYMATITRVFIGTTGETKK